MTDDLRGHYDVVCVGGAMTGSSVAYWLSEDPDFDGRVLVVEPDWTYASAQSSRAQNSIREQFTSRLNIELSRFGMEFIERFHDHVEVDGESPAIDFRGTGYLFLADDEDDYARLAAEAVDQRAAGVEVTMLRPAALAARFPFLDATQVAGGRLGGIREGSFDGWALLQGLRRRAVHNGVTYLRDAVVDLDVRAGRVGSVHLASGRRVGTNWVVNAAGCRAREIATMAGLDLPIEPRARTTFVFDCRRPIDVLVPLTITPAGVHFRRERPHFMCGTAPTPDVAVDPDDLAPRLDEFEDLIWPVLARYVPQFDEVRVVTSWGGQYDFNTFDHNLIIGPAATVPNLLFANGFSGHGLQQGPAVGRAICELVVHGGYRTIDLGPFGHDRIAAGTPIREGSVI